MNNLSQIELLVWPPNAIWTELHKQHGRALDCDRIGRHALIGAVSPPRFHFRIRFRPNGAVPSLMRACRRVTLGGEQLSRSQV